MNRIVSYEIFSPGSRLISSNSYIFFINSIDPSDQMNQLSFVFLYSFGFILVVSFPEFVIIVFYRLFCNLFIPFLCGLFIRRFRSCRIDCFVPNSSLLSRVTIDGIILRNIVRTAK